MTEKISNALIDEMLAGLEGVTPGLWHEGDKWVFVSPRSGRGGDALEDILRNEEGPHNVAHIARCDPDTIRALLLELRAYRTAANPLQSVLEMFPEPMTREEIRLENLKQMAKYEGPIVSFEVAEPFYLASCDKCGWVGSTELCGTDSWGDDSDVYCPRCSASGADCGKVAARLSALESTPAPVSEVTEDRSVTLIKEKAAEK